MPMRRGLSAGISGAFGGLGGAGQIFLHKALADEAAKRQDLLERGRIADEMIAKGTLEPTDRAAFIGGTYQGPSVQQQLADITAPITKASTYQEVPGEAALAGQFKAKRLPVMGFGETTAPSQDTGLPVNTGQVDTTGSGNLPSTQYGDAYSPQFKQILQARTEKIGGPGVPSSFPPEKITDVNPEDPFGTERTRFISSNPASLTGQSFQTKPSPSQLGKGKAQELLTGELSAPVIAQRGVQAGTEAGARTRADLAAQMKVLGMPAQTISAAMSLSDNFTNDSKEFFTQEQGFRRMLSAKQLLEAHPEEQGAGDLGLVFGYMKMLDPTSSVREGEQASVKNAGAVGDRVMNWYNSVLTGGKLPDNLRTDIMRQATGIYRSAATDHQRRVQTYSQRAAQLRIPPSMVIRPAAPDLGTPFDKVNQR